MAQTPAIPAAIEDGTRGVRPPGTGRVCTVPDDRPDPDTGTHPPMNGWPIRQSGADRGHPTPCPVVTVSTAPVTGHNQ